MKRIFLLSLTLLLVLTLTACGNADATPETTMPNAAATTQATMAATETTVAVTTEATEATTVATTEATTVATTEATTVATEPPTEPPVPETEAPTQPEHSWLYIPGVSVEDVIRYFNEVCLDAEYVSGGDPSKLQKWMEPIYYTLDGPYTDEDLETLTGFMEFLNTIDGFPGIYESQDLLQTNLQIYFRTQDGLVDLMGDNFWGCDGGVTFWYLNDEIYDATICYSTDVSQYIRNSVILEEIYNGLGPVQDTNLRPDSIIYAGYSEPQELTEMDKLLLILLYHPRLECGMNARQCEAVIRELYY